MNVQVKTDFSDYDYYDDEVYEDALVTDEVLVEDEDGFDDDYSLLDQFESYFEEEEEMFSPAFLQMKKNTYANDLC